MNFDFNEEQYLFQESFKTFLEEQYPLDTFIRSTQDAGSGKGKECRLWQSLAELGLFSMLVPEDFGGLGLSFIDLVLILEELGAALVPAPITETLAVQDLVTRYGTAAQQHNLLPALAAGEMAATVAIQEASVNYDIASIKTTVERRGDQFVISGRKIMVPGATAVDCIVVLALDTVTGNVLPVIVDLGAEGMAVHAHIALDGSQDLADIVFDNVCVDAAAVVGSTSSSSGAERLFDTCAFIAASMATGIGRKALAIAVDYASQRIQFDKPIGSFQAIKHRCADMAVSVDAAQSAAYYASWSVAEDAADRKWAVSIAKSYCGDVAQDLVQKCTQIHGGMGFTWELGIHYYLRRACVLNAAYGNTEFHRERVVAGSLAHLGLAS